MNFDQIIDRHGTDCVKHDLVPVMRLPEDTLPLWVADMDFPAPECVGEALHRMIEQRIYGYSFAGKEYHEAVMNWFQRRFGWTIKEEWLVETPGVVFALCTAVRAFTKPGDGVAMLLPVYNHFFEAVEDNGRRVVASVLQNKGGRYEIDWEDLERKLDEETPKLFLLCSPHNPVGRVWTEEELRKLGQLCFERNILVVADEIHCDFTYSGHRHIPFQSLGEAFARQSISCTAPSKTFNLAGLKTSNIVIPDDMLRNTFRKELDKQGAGGVNLFGMAACRAAYEGGEGWLEELRSYLWGNYQKLCRFVEQELPELKVTELEGTYLAWVDVSGLNLTAEEQDELLTQKARVWLNRGETYGQGGENFWRFNLACPRSVLVEALERLRDAIHGA